MAPTRNRAGLCLAGLSFLGLGLALVPGCQRLSFDFAEVEGVIRRDGQPVPHVRVIFYPDDETGTLGPQSRGFTDKTGRYQLRTHKGDVGAVVGRHRVCVVEPPGSSAVDGGTVELRSKSTVRVPPEYSRPANTPLRDVEVKPGTQTLNLDLK